MRCKAADKIIYPTRADAWRAIQAIRRTRRRKATYAYPCADHWHITSQRERRAA